MFTYNTFKEMEKDGLFCGGLDYFMFVLISLFTIPLDIIVSPLEIIAGILYLIFEK